MRVRVGCKRNRIDVNKVCSNSKLQGVLRSSHPHVSKEEDVVVVEQEFFKSVSRTSLVSHVCRTRRLSLSDCLKLKMD